MNLLFIDVETLGLKPSFGMTQVAYIITSPSGEELTRYSSFVYYDESYKDTIDNFEYNRTTYEDCKNGLTLEKIYKQLFKDIKKYNVKKFLSYNVTFDYDFIFAYAKKAQKLILSELDKHCIMKHYCRVFELKRWQKLVDAYWCLFEDELENAHDAINDVLGAFKIHFALIPHEKAKEKRDRIKYLRQRRAWELSERVLDLSEHLHLFIPYADNYVLKGSGHIYQYRNEVIDKDLILLEFSNRSSEKKTIYRIWHNQYGGGSTDICKYDGELEGRYTFPKEHYKKVFLKK